MWDLILKGFDGLWRLDYILVHSALHQPFLLAESLVPTALPTCHYDTLSPISPKIRESVAFPLKPLRFGQNKSFLFKFFYSGILL